MKNFKKKSVLNQQVVGSEHHSPVRYVAEKIRTVVPAELAAIPNWITWEAGPLRPDGKFDKRPRGRDGWGGRWQMPDQWMGFTEAIDAAHSRGHSGVGLVLPAQTPAGKYVVALDYDSVDLTHFGSVRVQEIMRHHESLGSPYFEASPSGKGIRMFVLSAQPVPQISVHNPLGGKDELFCASSKWVTITGNTLGGTDVPEATEAITGLARQWASRAPAKPTRQNVGHTGSSRDRMLGHLSRGWEGWPMRKLRDGEGREEMMLAYAGHLRARGLDQATIEHECLAANKEHYEDRLEEAVVLDRAQRYAVPSLGEAVSANDARYKLLSPVDIHALPAQQWRIKNILPATGIAAIFGPSGSGKSFLAVHMAAAIVAGRKWFGKRIRQAHVVYVMLEGEGGIRNRIAALERDQGLLPPARFSVVIQPFHLTAPQDVADLAAVIPDGAVVIVDTLNRAAPTVDENSSKDMGLILEGAKSLQAATGGLVVVVHHTGKDASKGMRGHSSLHAALDAAIEVERSAAGIRTWSVAKSKDGEDGKQVAFKLVRHVLGQDEDGEDITSCTVEPDNSGIFVKPEPQGRQQKAALKAVKSALNALQPPTSGMAGCPAGTKRMKVEDAIVAVVSVLTTTAPNKRRSEARRLITSLNNGGYLSTGLEGEDGWCWLE
jgi:hypothetical protein